MAIYIYRALNTLSGQKIRGNLVGEDEGAIRSLLIEQGLYPIDIRIQDKEKYTRHIIKGMQPKPDLKEVTFLCKQLVMLLQAGISLLEALYMCEAQCKNKQLKTHIRKIGQSVNEGITFSQAMARQGVFPEVLVGMIACGELSGQLYEVLKRAVGYLEDELKLKRKVKKALAYPMLVMGIVCIVVALIMLIVIPRFVNLLQDTGAPIPMATQMVITMSTWICTSWQEMIGLFLGVVCLFSWLKRQKSIRVILDLCKIKSPIMGALVKKHLASRFTSAMALLIASGIPLLQALEMTQNILENEIAKEELMQIAVHVKSGGNLSEIMKKSKVFPQLLVSMLRIGEVSGSIDELFYKMSDYFKEEVEIGIERLIMLIEPTLTILIAIIIGGIMAAIILPTFSAALTMM